MDYAILWAIHMELLELRPWYVKNYRQHSVQMEPQLVQSR